MKKMKYIFLFIILISVCACGPNKKDLKALLNQIQFNKQAISDLLQYEKLKNITFSNLDTIFKFKNSHHIIDYYEGNKVTKKQEDDFVYQFFFIPKSAIGEESIESLPLNVYAEVNKIYNKLGKDKIEGFTLHKDSTIEVFLKNPSEKFDKETNAAITHELMWLKRKTIMYGDPDSLILSKDTTLAKGWKYYIFADAQNEQ